MSGWAGVHRRGGLGAAAGWPRIGGADLVLTSDVPLGAGLSSSAALECATVSALADLNGLDIDMIAASEAGAPRRRTSSSAPLPG